MIGIEENTLTQETSRASLLSVEATLEMLAIDLARCADQMLDEGWAKQLRRPRSPLVPRPTLH